MAKARPSVQKRNRELRNMEKRERKAARKAERETQGGAQDLGYDGDPDLAGIVPGPQPRLWE